MADLGRPMTREEAEAVAARLVTVEDDSWSIDGVRYSGWIVRVAGRTVSEYSVSGTTGTHSLEVEAVWREAIVRALVEG